MKPFLLILLTLPTLAGPGKSLELARAAVERTKSRVTYDPGYFSIPYPNGDIPADRGVCTDVVIRSLRKLGIDLQQLVHEDMKRNFDQYPKIFGLRKPDPNIDHRRVPNLRVFFQRQGASLPITEKGKDYQPGDIVTWELPTGQGHIGIISDKKVFLRDRHQIVHNIGAGDVMEDVLFDWKITGHYRYPRES